MNKKWKKSGYLCVALIGSTLLNGCKGITAKETGDFQTSVMTEDSKIETKNQAMPEKIQDMESQKVTEKMSGTEKALDADISEEAEKVTDTEDGKADKESVQEKKMYESYAKIVERYQKAFECVKNTGMPENIPEYTNMEFYAAVMYQQLDCCGFQLYDLNSDGTPELFVGLYPESSEDDLFIYDVYTWSDGMHVRLMEDIGYRAGTCIICEGGIIKDVSSGSAADSMQDYHYLPEGGWVLELIDSISVHGDVESGEIHYYHDHDGNADYEITEEEYSQIEDSYVEVTGLTSYGATEENICQLRNGNLSAQSGK